VIIRRIRVKCAPDRVHSDDLQTDRLGMAADFARAHQVTVVLKGYRTIIATPSRPHVRESNRFPRMATGGTGDVPGQG
jgi:NAD(P)H-hydrate epimerase